jgi:RNA polymerase sigma factor (sigma-70 family)
MDALCQPESAVAAQAPTERVLAPEDVAALYERESTRVRRLVRLNVTAPDAVIEDACQIAWMRLVSAPERVRAATVCGWLVRVASREATRGARHATRDLPFDEIAPDDAALGQSADDGVQEIAEQHRRLETIEALPERQRRLVWLRGLGFTRREIADETGDSMRTVERQLGRARASLQRADAV